MHERYRQTDGRAIAYSELHSHLFSENSPPNQIQLKCIRTEGHRRNQSQQVLVMIGPVQSYGGSNFALHSGLAAPWPSPLRCIVFCHGLLRFRSTPHNFRLAPPRFPLRLTCSVESVVRMRRIRSQSIHAADLRPQTDASAART